VEVEAEALAYSLEIGASGIADARAWADAEILRSSTPSPELLDLATEGTVAGAISLLHTLGAGADRSGVGRRVYGHLLKALSMGVLSPQRAAEAVVRLARESLAPSQRAEDESWHFDDAFYLSSQGIYGSTREVAAELEEHLKRYAA
jgi:hypothetical protein